MTKKRKRPSKPPAFGGDHGTGTVMATRNTVVEPMRNDKGENPNNLGRRRRVDVLERFSLTQPQAQAAQAVRDAYSRCEMLSSGGPLKAKVDASPKPDATIAHQVDAQSHLVWVMKRIPQWGRYVVEHVCWHNRPVSDLGPAGPHSAVFKRALDEAARRGVGC